MRAHVNAKHSIGKDGPNSPITDLQSNDVTGCYGSSELPKLADNVLENPEVKNIKIHNIKSSLNLPTNSKKKVRRLKRTRNSRREVPVTLQSY